MQINTAIESGTLAATLVFGYAIAFAGVPADSLYEDVQHKTKSSYGYDVQNIIQPSFGTPEQEQVSLSPMHMISLLNTGLQTNDTEALTKLNRSLQTSLFAFASNTSYPEQYLRDNSLNELIQMLKNAELRAQANNDLALRKALAQSRSLAVRSQKMIDQRLVTPEIIEGRASAEGLKTLADMATERFAHMAG